MATIDTIRPTLDVGLPTWAVTGAASVIAAITDNSDASYVTAPGSGVGNALETQFNPYTPGGSRGMHQARVRARVATPAGPPFSTMAQRGSPPGVGPTWGAQNFTTTTTITTYVGPWDSTDASHVGDNGGFGPVTWRHLIHASALGDPTRVYEIYLDVDTREPPAYTGEVHDGAGVDRLGGTITDTNIPTYVFGTPNLDGLPANRWTLIVEDSVTSERFVDIQNQPGSPPSTLVSPVPLPNATYDIEFQVASTIRGDEVFTTQQLGSFTVNVAAPEAPDLTTTPTANPPSIEVCWTVTPGATTWDDDDLVVTEIRRTDCNGTQTIYVAVGFEDCHTDRFMSLTYSGVFCGESDHVCQVCYEARQWGLVDGLLFSTDWSTPACETSLANPTPGNAWIRGGDSGDLSICPDESFGIAHPFGAFQPIAGGTPTVVTGAPGGRDYTLSIPVTSEADLVTLLAILGQAIVYYQPVAAADLWLSAMPRQIQITKVGRIRVVDVPFVAVNPQPQADPASLVT